MRPIAILALTLTLFTVPAEARQHHHSIHHQHHLRHHTHIASASSSLAGLPSQLASIVNRIESTCPGMHPISAYRPGARIRGTGHQSLHAVHRAVDISGGSYACAYAVLSGFPGGVSTDPGRVGHIHISYEPGGREWGARFAHGGGHGHSVRYASRHHWRHGHYARM